jgi:predicted nucleotidyltransferase component of viral defense system
MKSRYTLVQYIELFHLLFLDQFGRKIDKSHYVLKGGCNLRFFLKSIRYSQDMDLDIHTVRKDTLANTVNRILESTPFSLILRAKNLEIINVSAPKQTNTTQRWKIQLKQTTSATSIHTKIEFSRRETEESSLFESVDPLIISSYHLTPIYASHYSMEQALLQKIWALILRTETQARDIFDIIHLFDMGIKIPEIPVAMRDRLKEAEENALSIPFQALKSQVISYLPLEYHSQYDDPNYWDKMIVQVCNALNEAL